MNSSDVSELCKAGLACLQGEPAFYPGDSFFIEPAAMTGLQLLFGFSVYGYVLFVSADMIGDGAELLLLVPGYSDIVGSVVLPVLGAIPDGMMVLFSGIGPLAVAQEQISVGVGALAGSTIMLLTLPWILSVYAGLVDYDEANGVCTGYKAKAGNRLTGDEGWKTGRIQFDDGVSKNAILMFLTSLSYFVIQIPALKVDDQKTKAQYGSEKEYLQVVIEESKYENKFALYGLIATLLFFALYMWLQYMAATGKKPPVAFLEYLLPPPPAPLPEALVEKFGLRMRLAHYRDNFQATGRMRGEEGAAMAYAGGADLLTDAEKAEAKQDGKAWTTLPSDLADLLKSKFKQYAARTAEAGLHREDMNDLLSEIGLNYERNDFKARFVKADLDASNTLEQEEFLNFFHELVTGPDPLPGTQPSEEEEKQDDDEDGDEEEDEMPEEFKDLTPEEQQKQILITSFKQMCIGTFLVLIFTDPMVDVLAQIGTNTGVPVFYVSFILAPLASNASELLSSFKLAAKKTQKSITQSLQTLEGAACMNNTFCLGIFFFLIYYQGLAWKFTAETFSIFFVQFLVFLIVISKPTQSIKEAGIIFLFYPISLVFVAVLEKCGFD